jgi:DNA-binding CsgD family transcriptional regulator
VLVVVDDAHWLDDESLRAILFAGRRISLDRVGIIAATRRVDREALDPRAFTAVEVNDLEAAEARRLASRVRNRQLTDGAARLHAITGGNPLALVELAGGGSRCASGRADRARGELAASGETLRARASLDLSEALTPQELQVARIVADGMSNREVAARLFLSTKTIEAHLHRVYRKLGITGRDQLAAALASRPM